MDSLLQLFAAFGTVLHPEYLLYALLGAAIGTAVGVLPGLGPTVTMSLLLPVVFALGNPLAAIIMFAAIFLLTGAGRSFGVDAFLGPRLEHAGARGNRAARALGWLT